MARHILDHTRAASAPRTPDYVALDRKTDTPHPASRALLQRNRAEPAPLHAFSRRQRSASDATD